MKAYKVFICLGLVVLFLQGCQSDVKPVDLVKFVRSADNGLHKQKSIGPLLLDVQYRPVDYVIANEFRKNNIDPDAYQNRKKELDGLQYYNLKIGFTGNTQMDITKYGIQNDTEQQERLYYLSFHMKHDIRMIQGQDTLAPVLYHFERSFDLSNHRTFVVAFEEPDQEHSNDKTLLLDTPILATGPLKIKFKKDHIKNIPNLKI